MEQLAGTFGVLGIIFTVFCVILGILTLFIPFFIYRIRNEMILGNKRLAVVIDLLQRNLDSENGKSVDTVGPEPVKKKIRMAECYKCKNEFPSADKKVHLNVTLCPGCWEKVQARKKLKASPETTTS